MKTALVVDFDGTIAVNDVGNELCERFAPAVWREIGARWLRQEISLPDAQRQMWALVQAEPEAWQSALREVGTLRSGWEVLLTHAQRSGWRLVLASGGFDDYIRALLGSALDRFQEQFFNHMEWREGRPVVSFPHIERLGCAACAVCKGRICAQYRQRGYRVVFVGDGSSDRCVLGHADRIFAVRDSLLAQWCEAHGASFAEFDTFHEVISSLSA